MNGVPDVPLHPACLSRSHQRTPAHRVRDFPSRNYPGSQCGRVRANATHSAPTVDRRCCHRIGSRSAVDLMPQPSPARNEFNTGSIIAASDGPSFAHSQQRLNDAPTLHFVIVLPDHPLFEQNANESPGSPEAPAAEPILVGGCRFCGTHLLFVAKRWVPQSLHPPTRKLNVHPPDALLQECMSGPLREYRDS